jgi:AcrR family transcriptional regulator
MFTQANMSTRKQRPRAPHQLPPGRHKLGRRYVEANQRQRILDAVADVASLAGYVTMSVEDIIATAGVSRRTFYDTFKGKQDVFLTALDDVADELVARVRAAYEGTDTFPSGVRDCLGAFLGFLAEEPERADMLLIESLAAGPQAIGRRNATLRAFAEMLHAGAERLVDGECPPPITAETIVGGIYEVVYSRLIAGEARELPSLLPDLAYSMLQPYIGHEAAKREAAKPAGADGEASS